jgi:hypothetical protein
MQIRKDAIEAAIVGEVGLLFASWTDTKKLMEMANEEARALGQQHASESVEVARELPLENTLLRRDGCSNRDGSGGGILTLLTFRLPPRCIRLTAWRHGAGVPRDQQRRAAARA